METEYFIVDWSRSVQQLDNRPFDEHFQMNEWFDVTLSSNHREIGELHPPQHQTHPRNTGATSPSHISRMTDCQDHGLCGIVSPDRYCRFTPKMGSPCLLGGTARQLHPGLQSPGTHRVTFESMTHQNHSPSPPILNSILSPKGVPTVLYHFT
ncbi:hypothetical protein J6590_082948 [Homalodisca vitripennis]|nr:hypothetical protein J6590_082948 [Homalodisca vitripennis]